MTWFTLTQTEVPKNMNYGRRSEFYLEANLTKFRSGNPYRNDSYNVIKVSWAFSYQVNILRDMEFGRILGFSIMNK